MIEEFNPNEKDDTTPLIKEGNELLAITVKSIKTTRNNNPR
jgi:hypothetical protein